MYTSNDSPRVIVRPNKYMLVMLGHTDVIMSGICLTRWLLGVVLAVPVSTARGSVLAEHRCQPLLDSVHTVSALIRWDELPAEQRVVSGHDLRHAQDRVDWERTRLSEQYIPSVSNDKHVSHKASSQKKQREIKLHRCDAK